MKIYKTEAECRRIIFDNPPKPLVFVKIDQTEEECNKIIRENKPFPLVDKED